MIEKHPDNCPCLNCEAMREAMEDMRKVEAFAMIREIHQQGGIPWEHFGRGAPPPKRGPLPRRTPEEQARHEYTLHKEAARLSLDAKGLPKRRGAKKKHTDRSLLLLMLAVDKLHADTPGKTDRDSIETYLKKLYREQGKRESRVNSEDVQAQIKTVLNLLSMARKRFRKPPV